MQGLVAQISTKISLRILLNLLQYGPWHIVYETGRLHSKPPITYILSLKAYYLD